MLTLKVKYTCVDPNHYLTLKRYRVGYSTWVHIAYNRVADSDNSISEKELREYHKTSVNNNEIDSWFVQSGVKESKQTYKAFKIRYDDHIDSRDKNLEKLEKDFKRKKISRKEYRRKLKWIKLDLTLVFGGKQLQRDRQSGRISKQEYEDKRLLPLYSVGEAPNKGNRKFSFNPDLTVTFKPSVYEHFDLRLHYGANQMQKLVKLFDLANQCKIPLTVKLDEDYIYISYEESDVDKYKFNQMENRVLGIDMNPNYIGVSIVDWYSSSEYNVVYSCVFDFKQFSDIYKKFKELGDVSPDDPRRIWLSNKRDYEVKKVVYKILELAMHYQCKLVSIENLKMKAADRDKGKNYNALINNHWLRSTFVNTLSKLCSINRIKFLKVKPEFSSFIGNLIFRGEDKPDMVLASIEIGRRGYEFYNQYIIKSKPIKKNIIEPDAVDFEEQIRMSTEELKLTFDGVSLTKLYYSIKAEADHPVLHGDPNKVRLFIDKLKKPMTVHRVFSQKSNVLLLD